MESDVIARIFWVVALKPEADAIIQHYQLKLIQDGNRGFAVWKSEAKQSTEHWLVISGIGKTNAAAATAWLYMRAGEPRTTAWINFGVAGHCALPLGEVIRANKVTDQASNRSWYPPAIWKRKYDLKSRPVVTVDLPSLEYPQDDSAVEMEASGFITVATRFASSELVQSVKVVSDNSETNFEALDRKQAAEFCRVAITNIALWVEELALIASQTGGAGEFPAYYAELVDRFNFTQTQQHQLKRLLTRRQALDLALPVEVIDDLKTGRQVLAALGA